MGRNLKINEDEIRFEKISKLCIGKILHFGDKNE